MEFPVIDGWPNHGVGRINLDGSLGSCSPCHARHAFSIETARKPYTCKQCHLGPDVPVYKVYSASKHGNVFHCKQHEWDFNAVPWEIGGDFTAPTCAVCHVSLLVDPDGELVAQRTHQMNNRIAWRIFGLVYSHAHPKDPDTTKIRNKDGLPLPTAFDGTPAADFLIGPDEQAKRRTEMETICLNCHGTSWVRGHFARYDKSHETTNAATLHGDADCCRRSGTAATPRGQPRAAAPSTRRSSGDGPISGCSTPTRSASPRRWREAVTTPCSQTATTVIRSGLPSFRNGLPNGRPRAKLRRSSGWRKSSRLSPRETHFAGFLG